MLHKLKKFYKKYKILVNIFIFLLILVILVIGLYKVLFYSSDEKSVYGIRLRDINEYEIKKSTLIDLEKQSSKIEGVESIDISVKGRLIKFFVKLQSDYTKDVIKTKSNELLSLISEDLKNYYDVTIYIEQEIDGEKIYPIIGYKHKSKKEMTFDEL